VRTRLLLFAFAIIAVSLIGCVTVPPPGTPGAAGILVFRQTVESSGGLRIEDFNRHYEIYLEGPAGFRKTIRLGNANRTHSIVLPFAGVYQIVEMRSIYDDPAKNNPTGYKYPYTRVYIAEGTVTVLNYRFTTSISPKAGGGMRKDFGFLTLGAADLDALFSEIRLSERYYGWTVARNNDPELRIAVTNDGADESSSGTSDIAGPGDAVADAQEVPEVQSDSATNSAVVSVGENGTLQALQSIEPDSARTALIVANAAYEFFPPLATPVPEATALGTTLTRLGFDVTLVANATQEELLDALIAFESKLRERGGLALFHYGGHGVQVDGYNYMIPVDADIPDERRVRTRAVQVDEVIASLEMSGSNTNVVILDACRDNPLPRASRSAARGLSTVTRQPPDSIIVYSAEAGTTAQDGIFTPTLIRYLEEPGLRFTDILRMVRRDVREATNGAQRPGAYDQLETEIYLAGSIAD